MKNDILNKKKEMMKSKNTDIKVEFIGVPSFMNPNDSNQDQDALP